MDPWLLEDNNLIASKQCNQTYFMSKANTAGPGGFSHMPTGHQDTRQWAVPQLCQDRQRRSPPLRLCSAWN